MRCLHLIALGCQASFVVAGQAYANIFNVDTASCQTYINSGQLQKIIDEAASMAGDGVNMYNDATQGKNYAEAYLYGLFGGAEAGSPQASQVGKTLNAVFNFLGRGMIPPGNDYKPWLFCNDDNFQLISNLDIAAVQNDGRPATVDGENRVSIRNLYARQIAATRANGNDPNVYLVKFPATGDQPETYQYYFITPTQGRVCFSGAYGETFTAELSGINIRGPVALIVLCPASFSYGTTDTLGGIDPMPASPATQGVSALQPYSFTFLHEMMHYCPWNPPTNRFYVKDFIDYDNNGNVILNGYALDDAIQLTDFEAIQNAQNYAFFSLGSYYTFKKPDNNGRYVSYATGYCEFLQA